MSATHELRIRGTASSCSTDQSHLSSTCGSVDHNPRKVESTLYNDVAVRFNENSLEQCRTSVSVLSGCVAGIVGLTSYNGFLFYAFSMLLLSIMIFLFIRNEYRKFFASLNHVFINGFFNGLLTYVLFWTFLYGMIHVY